MELFDFMGFLCVCFPRKFLGLLEIGLVTVFIGLFLGFIFCFFLDLMEIWLLDLDLGFVRD